MLYYIIMILWRDVYLYLPMIDVNDKVDIWYSYDIYNIILYIYVSIK